jgi:glycosyltransferase involved in cell wall biosynthesis
MLARADAACLCSSAEGLSNALMEAMAARLPIVATRVGGNPELVTDNGILIPSGDPRALAEALATLLQLPERRELGLRGRRRIEAELTLDRLADSHAALYRRALGAAPYVPEERAFRAA